MPYKNCMPYKKGVLKNYAEFTKDAAGQRCSPKNRRRNNFRKSSAKKLFLKINYVLRKTVAPLMNMQAKDLQVIKKRFQHLYFIVNFDWFLRIIFSKTPNGNCFCHRKTPLLDSFKIVLKQNKIFVKLKCFLYLVPYPYCKAIQCSFPLLDF